MLGILQSIFITILTPIAKVSSKLSDRIRAICIQLTCFLFPLYFIYYYTGLKHKELFVNPLDSDTGRHLMGCVFLLLLIVFSLDRIPQRVKWSVWIMYPMIICGMWMLVISFIHPVGDGYRAFAMMLVIAFPCLYLVWNNRGDYEKLFDPLARATAIIGFLFFLFTCSLALKGELFIEYNTNRCSGEMANANLFSMVGMVAACGALYLLVKKPELNFRFLFYCLALGAGIAIVIMGQSRVSLAVCLSNMLIALFFYLRYSEKSKLSLIGLKLFCVIGFIITMALLSQLCLLVQYNVEAKAMLAASGVAVDTTEVVEESDPSAEPETAPVPVGNIAEEPSILDRFEFSDNMDLDLYTAGRWHIWKGYAYYFNLLGNDFSKANWDVLTQSSIRHAHNNFFEMAYRFGVPLGILFILFEIIVCLKMLQYIFVNRRKQIVLLFSIIFVVLFFFESMLDIATLPFERDAPFYFYIALIPMVDMNFQFKNKA